MAIQWSGLGPELLLRLDRGQRASRSGRSSRPGSATRSGAAGSQGGERLPSSRELARELGMSRGLVQECYGQLLAEGYLDQPGRLGDPGCERGCPARLPLGAASRARRSTAPPADRGFPVRAFRTWRASRAATGRGRRGRPASRVATADLDYGDPRGSAALRRGARRVPAAGAGRRRRPMSTSSSAPGSPRGSTSSCRR